jgi:tetratricopeptide (TPR) repeat protein
MRSGYNVKQGEQLRSAESQAGTAAARREVPVARASAHNAAPRRAFNKRRYSRGVAMAANGEACLALSRTSRARLAAVFAVGAHAQDTKKQAEELMRQGQQQMSKGQPRDAIRTLGKSIELDPTRPTLYMLRSRARDSSAASSEALDDATKYIELEPKDEYGYLNRARIYLSLEKPEKALEDANKAIEMKPDEPDGYYRRADVYTAMNKDAEAKADEKKADELDAKARH